jgi:phage major head subunit gpT-like protein
MSLVTSDVLAGLLTNFRVVFKQGLDELDATLADYKKVATIFPSTTNKESYGWLGANPAVTEWKDRKKLYGVGTYDYTLTNKDYEATIEVDRNTIEDDRYGLIAPRIRGLSARAHKFLNEKVFTQLDGVESLLAYDGAAVCSATRTAIGDSGTIVNHIYGAYSGSTTEVLAAIDAVLAGFRNMKDDRGIYMNLVPDTIVCSPAMEMLIRRALQPQVAGVPLPQAGLFGANIIASPWVDADALDWYVLCTSAEVKPILLQMRKEPQIVSVVNPEDSHVFMSKTFLYGVEMRLEVGYGDPRTVFKVVDT